MKEKTTLSNLDLEPPAPKRPVIVSIRSMLHRAVLRAQLGRHLARVRRRSKWIRPPELRADGTNMNRREIRDAFIRRSQLQGVAVAKQQREKYVIRRNVRWKAVIEANMPRMFNDALKEMGLA